MSFGNIKGQDEAVAFLRRAVEAGRVSHAYIFSGPKGVGKMMAAVNFAKALLCAQAARLTPPDGCGLCNSCKNIDSFRHPDMTVIKTEKDSATIKIEQVRELIRSIGLKSAAGGRKVYIIDNADLLTAQAENAFLKTLEEPPPGCTLILITDNIDSIFPTIISRCQVLKFFTLTPDAVKDILVNEHKLDGIRAHIASRLSSGSIGEALGYADDRFFQKRSNILKLLEDGAFLDPGMDAIPKEEIKPVLDIMLAWYRDALIAKAGMSDEAYFINIDNKDVIMNRSRKYRLDQLEDCINSIVMAGSLLDDNVNSKLVMSTLGLKLARNQ